MPKIASLFHSASFWIHGYTTGEQTIDIGKLRVRLWASWNSWALPLCVTAYPDVLLIQVGPFSVQAWRRRTIAQ